MSVHGNALGLVTLISPCNDDIVFGFVDRSDTAMYRCYKDFEYDNAIATIGKEVSVYIIRDKRGVSIPTEDIFGLPLRFMDMIGTCYEQRIAVQILINEKDGFSRAVYNQARHSKGDIDRFLK